MKLKYIVSGAVASSLLFASCGKKEKPTSQTENKEAAPVLEPTAMATMLEGKTVSLNGDAYAPTQVAQNADYYLLYFTASW